jgi:putative membrane protein
MKSQWVIVCGLLLALLTAIVAVFNVTSVPLDYIFGEVQVSLIIIMSACILIGGFIVTLFGTYRPYKLQKEKENFESLNTELTAENADLKEKLAETKSAYSMLKKEEEIRHETETIHTPQTESDKVDKE